MSIKMKLALAAALVLLASTAQADPVTVSVTVDCKQPVTTSMWPPNNRFVVTVPVTPPFAPSPPAPDVTVKPKNQQHFDPKYRTASDEAAR